MNIRNYIKNNIDITFDKNILDSDLNSDDNELLINTRGICIGCDVCRKGILCSFKSNLFKLIEERNCNLNELIILNKDCINKNTFEDFYICRNNIFFDKISELFNKFKNETTIKYKLSKNKTLVKENYHKFNSCFEKFKNNIFTKENTKNIKEIIICTNCKIWLNIIYPEINESLLIFNPFCLYWRYFINNIINNIIFNNTLEKQYIIDKLELKYLEQNKQLIIN